MVQGLVVLQPVDLRILDREMSVDRDVHGDRPPRRPQLQGFDDLGLGEAGPIGDLLDTR